MQKRVRSLRCAMSDKDSPKIYRLLTRLSCAVGGLTTKVEAQTCSSWSRCAMRTGAHLQVQCQQRERHSHVDPSALQKSKQVLPNARSSVNEPGIKELKREAVKLARGELSKSSWRGRWATLLKRNGQLNRWRGGFRRQYEIEGCS